MELGKIRVRRHLGLRPGRLLGGIVIEAKGMTDLVGERMQKRPVLGVLRGTQEDRVEFLVVGRPMNIHLKTERMLLSHLQWNGYGKYDAVGLGEYAGEGRLESLDHACRRAASEASIARVRGRFGF